MIGYVLGHRNNARNLDCAYIALTILYCFNGTTLPFSLPFPLPHPQLSSAEYGTRGTH